MNEEVARQASWALQRAADTQQVEKDQKKVGEHVKSVMFEKVVFVWAKTRLNLDGRLHEDYLKNCRALLAKGKLLIIWDDEAIPYMNILWEVMKKDQCYINWLMSRCCNTYQAMQDKFTSECEVYAIVVFKLRHSLVFLFDALVFLAYTLHSFAHLLTLACHSELCKECAYHGTALPSLESFAKQWRLPKVHFLFYHDFYMAFIGDARWKSRLVDGKRLGHIIAKAYAHTTTLHNHYFAWL
jgi:hypothetical protein